MQGTVEFHHQIADAFFPEADAVFDTATTLDTAVDMLDPRPPLVQGLVHHVLLPRDLLPQIEINSNNLEPILQGLYAIEPAFIALVKQRS